MNTEDDDSISCPVCKEHFTDGAKIPACLKCGHVLCRECAFKILRNSDASGRVCPICRSPSTFTDIRTIYFSNIRIVNDRSFLEMENEQLRERLRIAEKKLERNAKALQWLEKEHSQKCKQRSKMITFYQKNNEYLYRKMKYYRSNWYRLKHNFNKMRMQKDSELSILRNHLKILNNNRNELNYRRRLLYNIRISPL